MCLKRDLRVTAGVKSRPAPAGPDTPRERHVNVPAAAM